MKNNEGTAADNEDAIKRKQDKIADLFIVYSPIYCMGKVHFSSSLVAFGFEYIPKEAVESPLFLKLIDVIKSISSTISKEVFVAVSPTLQSFADNYTWFMAGLGAAGAMMRFVGFSILMKIMMAADMWGWLLAGFAMALLFGNVEATASAALILIAFIGLAIALLDFRINSLAKTAEGGMSDGI